MEIHYPSGIDNGSNKVRELLLNSGSVCFVVTYHSKQRWHNRAPAVGI
jgi:hypothetical protein